VPAVEVLLNTKLVADLIDKGELAEVKEAVEKSMTEGSQTFEQDLARLIGEGVISRDEGLAHADSPTNLLWRLQNDHGGQTRVVPKPEEADTATFTEMAVDVRPEESRSASLSQLSWPTVRQ
ncbi:MAG: type IV pili twitching motility protein PilT, partial [Rubrivivax sp.]